MAEGVMAWSMETGSFEGEPLLEPDWSPGGRFG